MRYVGLVFLGLVLGAGQAAADLLEQKSAEEIILKGEIIHKHVNEKSRWFEMRVIHKDTYYKCIDFYLAGEGFRLKCWSVD